MKSILISSESRYKVDRARIRKRVKEILEKKGLDEVEVSVLVVGIRKSRTLNHKFREVNQETNVLSFPQESSRGEDGVLTLGDIVICYPVARGEAAKENKLVDDKVEELLEHGLGHLLGEHHD